MALAQTLSAGLMPLDPAPPEAPEIECVGRVLHMQVERQSQDLWCWAAVALAVAHAYGNMFEAAQCDVAGRVKERPCCPFGRFSACDRTHALSRPLGIHHDKLTVRPEPDKSFALVKACIDEGRPIAVRIAFSDASSGHFVVITGYCEIGMTQHLWVCDPLTGSRSREGFDSFLNNYKGLNVGGWQKTFLTKGVLDTDRIPEEIA
jgi:hypothetical protein